jgi:hypothetical protein
MKPKKLPKVNPEQAKATYFLAQKSGLFRPGASTILANSIPARKGKGKRK